MGEWAKSRAEGLALDMGGGDEWAEVKTGGGGASAESCKSRRACNHLAQAKAGEQEDSNEEENGCGHVAQEDPGSKDIAVKTEPGK